MPSSNLFFRMSVGEFYTGDLMVSVDQKRAFTVEEMHECMDFDLLERSHTFIQWLFPTNERSHFNAFCALLNANDARRIAHNLCTAMRVRESFVMMLEFFGFDLHADGTVVKRDDARLIHMVRHSHNWMRISRMLRSLVLLGLAEYADAFFKSLSHEVDHGVLSPCRAARDNYWYANAYNDSPPGFPLHNCLASFSTFKQSRQITLLCAIVRGRRCVGAQRALRQQTSNDCIVVGVMSSKTICTLAPARMRLVVLQSLRRRVVTLYKLTRTRDATVGFRMYKRVRNSLAYGGDGALCDLKHCALI